MENYSAYASDGTEIYCIIDAETSQAMVEWNGEETGGKYIRFLFNPDFPQDAKKFFEALCTVKEIIVDE